MPDGPVVTTETRKRQREAHDTVTHDIKDAVEDFISRLHDIAKKHEQFVFSFLHHLNIQ
jgi:hypothetical protein